MIGDVFGFTPKEIREFKLDEYNAFVQYAKSKIEHQRKHGSTM